MLTLLLSLMAGYILLVLVLLRGRLSSARGLDKCRKGLFSLSQATLAKKPSEEFSILHGQFGAAKLKVSAMRAPRGGSNQPRYHDLQHFTQLYTTDKKDQSSRWSESDFNLESRHSSFSSLVGGYHQNMILTGPKDSISYYPELPEGAYYRRGKSASEWAGQHQNVPLSGAWNTKHSHLKPMSAFGDVKTAMATEVRERSSPAGQLAPPRLSRGLWLRGRQRKHVAPNGSKTSLSTIFERSRDESEEPSLTRITATVDLIHSSRRHLVNSGTKVC